MSIFDVLLKLNKKIIELKKFEESKKNQPKLKNFFL